MLVHSHKPHNKVPEILLFFWIMKICATTLGETAGDLMSMTMSVGYAVSTIILMGVFAVTLVAQLMSKRYHPLIYWMVILSTSTAGTTMSDFMDRTLHLGYATGAAILSGLLAAMLIGWKFSGESLSVKHISSRKIEIMYWTTILISNTLGTALGDYLSDDSGLGFAGAATLVGSLIALTALLYYCTSISRVVLFWIAFVLTRPFGAEMGDTLTKTHEQGGLDLGTLGSSAVLAAILIACIAYTWATLSRKEYMEPIPVEDSE